MPSEKRRVAIAAGQLGITHPNVGGHAEKEAGQTSESIWGEMSCRRKPW
jgi:hypothetical protein